MRYIKKFDNIEVGDYIISYYGGDYSYTDDEFAKFINSNIGKVISMNFSVCDVMYEKNYKGKNVFKLSVEFIIFHSKNKEDAEVYLAIKKYNL